MTKTITRDEFSVLYTPDFGPEQTRFFERLQPNELNVGMKVVILFYEQPDGSSKYEFWRAKRVATFSKRSTDNFETFLPAFLGTHHPRGASHGLYAMIVAVAKDTQQIHITGVKDSWQFNFPVAGL